MAKPQVTILMPCLNEALTLGVCIEKANSWLESRKISGEILISDNGSKDKSVKIAKSLGARVVVCKQKGYGNVLRYGIAKSSSKHIIFGDSDDSYDFSDLDKFYDALEAGQEIVIGNRFVGGISKNAMTRLHYIGNTLLSGLGRLFFRVPVRDWHCGLRAVNKNCLEKITLQTTGMEFASELIIKSYKSKLRICEVPTTLHKDGRNRPSHLRTWSDGWRHVKLIFREKFS